MRSSAPSHGNSDKPGENGETNRLAFIYRHGHDGEAENPGPMFSAATSATIPRPSITRSPAKINRTLFGAFRNRGLPHILCPDGHFQLAFYRLFPAVLLPRTLAVAPQWLLPPLWRQPGQADRVGRKQLPQILQLALFNTATTPSIIFVPRCIGPRWTNFIVKIADALRREGVRVIKPPHAFGFLDPDLPRKAARSNQNWNISRPKQPPGLAHNPDLPFMDFLGKVSQLFGNDGVGSSTPKIPLVHPLS